MQITPEELIDSSINDEYLFRQLAQKIVSQIPFDELKKVMELTKIDPNSNEIRAKINDYKTPEYERWHYIELQRRNVILYKAKTNT